MLVISKSNNAFQRLKAKNTKSNQEFQQNNNYKINYKKSNNKIHHRHFNYYRNNNSSTLMFSWSCQSYNTNLTMAYNVPHLIIAGTQKGGTTALLKILTNYNNNNKDNNHLSSIIFVPPTTKREPHFFDWNVRPIPKDTYPNLNDTQACYFRHEYVTKTWSSLSFDTLQQQSYNNQSIIITLEKTPSYMIQPFVPKLIHDMYKNRKQQQQQQQQQLLLLKPHKPKIIILLRNPIDRAFSHYLMEVTTKDDMATKFPTFNHAIYNVIEKWRQYGITLLPSYNETIWTQLVHTNSTLFNTIPKRLSYAEQIDFKTKMDFLWRGVYIEQIKHWIRYFKLYDELLIINFEQFRTNHSIVLQEIFEFLNLSVTKNHWMKSNNIFYYDIVDKDYSPRMSKAATIKRKPQQQQQQHLSNQTRYLLQRLYRPYNKELADLLGEKWRGIWDN